MAADGGHPDAQTKLGDCYAIGKYGIECGDWKEARKWYRLAARQGWSEAWCVVSLLFFFSLRLLFSLLSLICVFVSLSLFFSFLFFSVKLGDMYVNGEGVPTNAKVAAKHYRVAAEKNHVRGMYLLGRTLCEGGGNKMLPNPSSGVPWLRKALKNGNKNAEKFLESLALLK